MRTAVQLQSPPQTPPTHAYAPPHTHMNMHDNDALVHDHLTIMTTVHTHTQMHMHDYTHEYAICMTLGQLLFYNCLSTRLLLLLLLLLLPLLLLLLLQPFYSPQTLSRTIRMSRYQKGKTSKVKPIWIYWSKR